MAKRDEIDLSDQRHREFLEKLADDNEFRKELKRRPREMMDEYGIPYDEKKIPDPVVLMPKRQVKSRLKKHLEHLHAKAQSIGCHVPAPVFPASGGKGKKPSKRP